MSNIFKELKELKKCEYELGKEEVKCLYLSDNLSMAEQLNLVECLTDKIIDMYKEKINNVSVSCLKSHFQDIPLIYYMTPLINKINTLVMEEIIEEKWIKELISNFIYNSDNSLEVKLGLMLSSRYLAKEKHLEVFEVFSKSGEYIFYLTDIIRSLNKYNSSLVKLSKNSKGTIKVFAITNIEYFDSDIISYLIEEGYKDEIYEDILINYIFTNINLSKYLFNDIKKDKLYNLSYILCSYLRKNEFSKIKAKYEFFESYLLFLKNKENNYNDLNSICLIREWLAENETSEIDTKELENKINKLLEDDKWINVFETSIREGIGLSEDIIALADFYEYKLEFKDLLPYLKRDYRDINIYYYLTEEGNEEDKINLFRFFEEHFNVDELCIGAKDIDDEKLEKEDIDYIILALIVRLLKDIYPHGKYVVIKAINGRVNKIRNESIKYLKKYRDKFTAKELEIIKRAYDDEPSCKIKEEIEMLICSYKDEKKEYMDEEEVVTYEHVADVYLINTEITGCQFRNRGVLEEELENSTIFNLKLEENNSCNNKIIKVVGESGFVIGLIYEKDNYILSNLLKCGKYLYGKIDKYNLENNSIDIRVYLSYKDVIESINDTILMLHGSNTGGFLN